ncbi:MAG TPA: hypothetical protein VF609_04825 [Flavisolibacter sp.]|jgi:hypothetical protein
MSTMMKANLLLSVVLVLFSQCRPAKMALRDENWPVKEEYKVQGKNGIFSKEKLQFGEFHTTKVKRSWTKGTSNKGSITDDYTNLISVDYINRKQTLHFSLADAGNRSSEVFCVSAFNTSEVQVGNRPNSIFNIGIDVVRSLLSQPDDKYYVQIYLKDQSPWELLVDNVQTQMKPKEYVGYLSHGKDNYYTIVPVREMEGKDGKPQAILFGSVGFEIRNKEGKAVAAVSKIDRGVVYLQNIPAEEKFLLANACAALLLQEVIS